MPEETGKELKNTLSRQVKIGLIVVIFLAVASAALGAIQISRTIKEPFLGKANSNASALASEEQKKEELKNLDTDKDGLSDYDELYIYNTSPFIEDSDSDGVPDKVEVLNGEDPNCPKGKNCFFEPVATSTPEINITPQNNTALNLGGLFTDAASLRAELRSLGLPDSLLSKIPDQDLQKLYIETLAEVLTTSTQR